MINYKIRFKGGPGSGHFGHKGRPGQVGGSAPAGASSYGNPNPALDESTMTSKMEEWISDNAINPDGTVDVDKAGDALWKLAQDIPDEYLNNGEFPEEWSEWLDNAIANVSPEDESFDDSEIGDLAEGMLADENSKKYPGLDPYSIDLIKTSERATAAGIKSYTDQQIVKDIARSAAEAINGRTKVGYTVYGSDSPHLSSDGQTSLGSFPMVAYGTESPAKVRGMINFLKDRGWKAVIGPENYGIIVGTIWDGVSNKEVVKSYKIRFKGGPGSGHFGHKGRPGQEGGSLPKDGAASSQITQTFSYKNYGDKRERNGVNFRMWKGNTSGAFNRGGDFVGTGLGGYISNISYDKLVEVFGRPTMSGKYFVDDKVRVTWLIHLDDGYSASIYDWKSEKFLNDVDVWNIGSKNKPEVVSKLSKLLGKDALVQSVKDFEDKYNSED